MKEELDGFKEKMKEEMEKDAARIEEAIRADEEISKMKASAELRDKVKERIEAYQREELLSKLSEEDREALRLGRELQKKKAGAEPDVEIAGEIGITAEDVKKAPVRKGKIVWKRVAVLAAAVIAVFANELQEQYRYTFTLRHEPLEEIMRIMSRIHPISYEFNDENMLTILPKQK